MNFELTQEQYESLVFLARKGAAADSADKVLELEEWLRLIEKSNNITRSFVMVQWQEAGSPLPTGTFFPTTWPPELRATIELVTRPVARDDVDKLLEAKATNPHEVMVTRDPNGIVGWTELDAFFTT